jgi:hypothetical protein
VHHAIAGRVFGVTGTPSAPVRMAHDAISSAVYAGLRAGAELAGRGADLALARRPEPAGPRLSTTPLGAAVIGAVIGLRGDSVELERSALCEPMCVRVEGESRDSGGTYGSRLESQTGLTPVWVRYNSGRRISENGCSLSGLLERLVGAAQRAAWLPLVRHSVSLGSPHMGALLERGVHVRSAGLAALPETRPLANFLRRRSGGIRDLRHGSLSDEDLARP